jgi:hypothetical protein
MAMPTKKGKYAKLFAHYPFPFTSGFSLSIPATL